MASTAPIHDPTPDNPESSLPEGATLEPIEEPSGEPTEEPTEDPSPPSPDFITTHILDQVSGTPAANITATLTLVSQKSRPSYTASTSPTTGRISNWTPSTPTTAPMEQVLPILAVIKSQSAPGWKSVWSLKFETGAYWEGRERERLGEGKGKGKGKEEGEGEGQGVQELGNVTFYPEVEIKFFVDPEDRRRHWHVPVLLGPHGYTTYRGS